MKRKPESQLTVSTRAESAMPSPSHEEIARLAYDYWEARSGLAGSSEEDWYRAEQEIRKPKKKSAGAGSRAK